jgi:chromosomal replication initiation ATPase DnaA
MNPYTHPGTQKITEIELIEILNSVTGATFYEAVTRRKTPELVFYRFAYWHFMRKLDRMKTLGQLGSTFHRTHASVIYALNKCENVYDKKLQNVLIKCSEKINSISE